MAKAIDLGVFFKIPADNRNLNYDKFIESGSREIINIDSYNSHNTERLDVNGMKKLLKKLELFK
jgi:UDP-glucose 4-epimerase